MRRTVVIAALSLAGLFSATAQTGQTWSGVLVDARCGAPEKVESGSPSNEGGERGSQAVRDRLDGQSRACRATTSTTKFALLLDDGSLLKFDTAGSRQAAAALRSAPKSGASGRKPAHVEVKGALHDGLIAATAVSLGPAKQ